MSTPPSGEPPAPPPRVLRRWQLAGPVPLPAVAGRSAPAAQGDVPARCWRAESPRGPVLLREYPGADRSRAEFRHRVMTALAAAGLPVPAPVPVPDTGRTFVRSAGHGYAVYPWTDGRPRAGLESSLDQCRELGELLGRTHAELDRLTPPVQQSLLVPATDADDALTRIDALARVGDRTEPTGLADRRALLTAYADHQPPQAEAMTAGYVHGDFHAGRLRYGRTRAVVAILGWRSLRIAPYATELVSAAVRLFDHGDGRGLDLERAESFVRGHAARFPLDPGQVMSAVHRLWWERLCDVGTGGAPPAAALVGWWTVNLDHTLETFATASTPQPAGV